MPSRGRPAIEGLRDFIERKFADGFGVVSGNPLMAAVIVPTLCVVTPVVTLRVAPLKSDAERPRLRSHAERGNDQCGSGLARDGDPKIATQTSPLPTHAAASSH